MPMHHPDADQLRAYADGELPPAARLRCAWHLRRCARCRAAVAAERQLDRRAAQLVGAIPASVDTRDGWERLSAVRPAQTVRHIPRAVWSAAAAALIGALALRGSGALTPAGARHRPDHQRDFCCSDLDGGGPGDDGVMTLSRSGQVVDCVVVYDDVDHSHTLTAGDIIRYVSGPKRCGLHNGALRARAGARTLASLER